MSPSSLEDKCEEEEEDDEENPRQILEKAKKSLKKWDDSIRDGGEDNMVLGSWQLLMFVV